MTRALFQQAPLFQHGPLHEAFHGAAPGPHPEDGPRISTMRNYRFAIVQYDPAEEFRLRGEVQRLTTDLAANGWMVIWSACRSCSWTGSGRRARSGSIA